MHRFLRHLFLALSERNLELPTLFHAVLNRRVHNSSLSLGNPTFFSIAVVSAITFLTLLGVTDSVAMATWTVRPMAHGVTRV
jgi:hypothetical protein